MNQEENTNGLTNEEIQLIAVDQFGEATVIWAEEYALSFARKVIAAHEAKKTYTTLSQEKCDRLQYATGGWTRKFREAHKIGWYAAMNKK